MFKHVIEGSCNINLLLLRIFTAVLYNWNPQASATIITATQLSDPASKPRN
jgi:hypothetical protein